MVPAPKFEARPPRVLIVDDEPLIRANLAESLRDAGFSVVEAANAEEALAYIEAGSPVDLVFSDVRMPGRLDGIALSQQLKTTHPLLPVILTSGDFGSRNISDLEPFIRKPYRYAPVIALMVQLLGLPQPDESGE